MKFNLACGQLSEQQEQFEKPIYLDDLNIKESFCAWLKIQDEYFDETPLDLDLYYSTLISFRVENNNLYCEFQNNIKSCSGLSVEQNKNNLNWLRINKTNCEVK